MADQTPQPVDRARFKAPPRPPTPPSKAKGGVCTNQPTGGPLIPSLPATIARRKKAMADASKRWDVGKTLNVSFLTGDGDPWGERIQQAVRNLAPVWCKYANLKFVFDQPTAHIAVNVLPSNMAGYRVYNCFIGTDCVDMFKQGYASMNLVFYEGDNPDPDEFHRVIPHEFGHAIGLIHEHQRPDRPITWNEDMLLQQFGSVWDITTIRQQIESVYDNPDASLLGTAFDIHSIMMYWFIEGTATYDNGKPFETPTNTELSPMDKVLANMLYPASGVTDPDEKPLVPGDPPVAGAIQVAGQVARYRFHAPAAGLFSINTQGTDPLLVSVLAKRMDPAGQLLAVEGAGASLRFNVVDADKDYFIEVRHATPMTGTGSFSVAVRSQG